MATNRLSQKSIKQIIKDGAASDLNEMYRKNKYSTKGLPTPGSLTLIGTSKGQSGHNGALFRAKSGKLYAIASRSSLLFYYL